jgi:hypothetical protein
VEKVRIQIESGATPTSYNELADWLTGNREFRGRVKRVTAPPADGQLGGGVVDVLEVALGSGGAGIVLAQSLSVWLRNRRADITITVTRAGKKVAVSAQRVSDPEALLRQVLDTSDEP